jgi:aminocarboxymuconate-semialdehyde decarboxylase
MVDIVSRTTGRVVDIHIHAIPPALVESVAGDAFANVGVDRYAQGLVFTFPGMAPSPPAQATLADFPLLAEWARREGIDVQMVGPWTDLLGYTLSPPEAVAWTRAYNEGLVAACAQQRGMIPLATVPLQFPRVAAREMEAAHSMGCRGVIVGSEIPDLDWDAPELDPVWEAAAGLSMPLLVHPTFICVPPRLRSRGLKNAIGRASEVTVALTRLVYSGALLRNPGLSVVAALGGGGLVPQSGRIIRNYELGWADTKTDVEASLRRLRFDSVVTDPTFLHYLVRQVGADRVMLGSDYPFPWEKHPVRSVEEAGLSPEETAALLGGTASRLFGIF